MSELYPILCEDCQVALGTWQPPEGVQVTDELIADKCHKGYICSDCARERDEAQRSDG